MALNNARTPESRKGYKGRKVSLFCQRIRERRLDLGLKQSEVAERAVVPQSQISKWEGGVYIDDPEKLAALARALETTPDYLFGFREEP